MSRGSKRKRDLEAAGITQTNAERASTEARTEASTWAAEHFADEAERAVAAGVALSLSSPHRLGRWPTADEVREAPQFKLLIGAGK